MLTDLSANLSSFDKRLYIQGSVTWRPVGETWFTQLGFTQGVDFNLFHLADQVYDFGQSANILVQFPDLPNAFQNSVVASFHVNNNASFGQRIQHYFFSHLSNQYVDFSSPQNFSFLRVRILDGEGRLMRTPINNLNGLQIVMNISVYTP